MGPARSFLELCLLSLLLAETSARMGAGILPLVMRRRALPWESMSLGFVAGWSLAAMAFFGLALTGLFYPGVIGGSFLAMLAGSRAAWTRRLLIAESFCVVRSTGRAGRAALLLGSCIILYSALPELLVPVTGSDAYTYHLGAPWQYLLTHRIQLDHVTWAFHLPMPAEMFSSIALILGDDRLAKWFPFVNFLAATLFVMGYFGRRGEKQAAWIGPLLMMGTYHCLPLLSTCKNDMPATAMFIMGALLSVEGAWPLSGLLLGSCVAAKPVLLPMVGMWLIIKPFPRRLFVPVSAALLIPYLGWLLKAYWATGNPFGLAAAWIDTYDWGPANDRAWQIYNDQLLGENIGFAKLPENWLKGIYKENPLALLLLPGMFLLGSRRKEALACVLAQFATMKMMSEPRFVFASIWLICLLAGLEVSRMNFRFKSAVTAVVGVLALVQLLTRHPISGADWGDARFPRDEYRRSRLTTYDEAVGILKGLRPRRVLHLGEFATYRIPGRVVYAGALGETPLVWKIARESPDIERFRRKFKQLGTDFACHNYISAEMIAFYYTDFQWDRRMIRLYVDYMKSYQSVAASTYGNDFNNGGFYMYRVHASSPGTPHENIWFLPGAERIFNSVKSLDKMGLLRAALVESKRVLELAPDVGQACNTAGHYYLANGYVEEAFRHLEPYVRAGMIDTANVPDYGSAARRLGLLDLAEAVLLEALPLFRPQRDFICAELAMVYVARARIELENGNAEEAGLMLDRAEPYVKISPAEAEKSLFRRQVAGVVASVWDEVLTPATAGR